MSFIDIAIILLLVVAIWRGFKKGFILELFTFLALFIGLYAGIHFSDFMANLLRENVGMTSEYVPVIAFTIVFLAIGAMVYFGGKALEKVIKVVQLSLLNKLLGIFFSLAKTVFILGGIILLMESYDEKSDFISNESKEGSVLYNPIKNFTTATIPAFEESTIFLKNKLKEEPNKDVKLLSSEA